MVANRTDEWRVEVIAALRRLRMTGAEIAEALDLALSTVSRVLTRIGMGKLGRIGLEPERHLGILRSELTTIREKTRDGPSGRKRDRAELLGPRSRGAFLSFDASRESFLGSCARSS